MKVKTTKAGSRARDFDQLGDPFIPEGELLSDAPDAASVAADVERMNRRFDGLAIDGGMGPTPIGTPENAAQHDARHELERRMRDQVLFGPPPNDPFAHGHRMATTAEGYLRFAPASEREPIEAAQREQTNFADGLMSEYATRFPDLASDTEGLSAAIDYTMNQLKWHGMNPGRWAREHPEDFLRDVEINHRAGLGRSTYVDSGRTAGIYSSGPATPHSAREPDTMSDTEWTRQMQRAKGIY